MLFDLLLGILGPAIGGLILKFFGKTKISRKQKILVFLLTGLTFIFYVIFGVVNYGLEEGSELNFGAFQLSYGISHSILILLVVILPVLLGTLLVISLKNFKWLVRLTVPLLLVLAVVSINFFQTYRGFKSGGVTRLPFVTELYSSKKLVKVLRYDFSICTMDVPSSSCGPYEVAVQSLGGQMATYTVAGFNNEDGLDNRDLELYDEISSKLAEAKERGNTVELQVNINGKIISVQ